MVFELIEIIGLFKLGYTKQAFAFLSKLLLKHQSKESLSKILSKLYDLAQDSISKKYYKLSLQVLSLLEDLSTKLKDFSKLCDVKNSMSFCYRVSNLPNESLSKCLEALEVVALNPEIHIKLPALHLNACAIYREEFGDMANALTHAKLAYFFAKENLHVAENAKRTLAVSIYNYGFIFDEIKELKSAEHWYSEGLKFCEDEYPDESLANLIHFKLKHLRVKLRLLNKRINSEKHEHLRRNTSHGHRIKLGERNLESSKGNRREIARKCSTPIQLRSVLSNERSTEHSVNVYDHAFNIRKCRNKKKFVATLRHIDFNGL